VKFLTISIQNANFARAEARTALRVINCLLLTASSDSSNRGLSQRSRLVARRDYPASPFESYKFGAGVVWIGVPSQRGGHGNGCGGRGVGIGLVWAGTTAAMPAMNKSKQSITPKSRTLNFILGVSMRSIVFSGKGVNPKLYHYQTLAAVATIVVSIVRSIGGYKAPSPIPENERLQPVGRVIIAGRVKLERLKTVGRVTDAS